MLYMFFPLRLDIYIGTPITTHYTFYKYILVSVEKTYNIWFHIEYQKASSQE